MPIVFAKNTREFNIPNIMFTTRATPASGSTENSVWQIRVAPKTPGAIHQLTREEIIVAISGQATVTLGEQKVKISVGDTVIVPPHVDFGLANEGNTDFEGLAILGVGGQAVIGGEAPFTPPWAM